MKSLERRFNNLKIKNSYFSTYLCFAEAIKGKNFGKQAITRWFNKLVSKDDYEKSEKNGIVKYLIKLTNTPEDNQK